MVPSSFQQHEKRVQVVRGCHRVEDEVESASVRGHLVRILRHHNLLRPKPQRVGALARRRGEQHHVRPHGGDLHTHVAQAAPAPDA